MRKFVSISEAAELLGVDRHGMHSLISRGEIAFWLDETCEFVVEEASVLHLIEHSIRTQKPRRPEIAPSTEGRQRLGERSRLLEQVSAMRAGEAR